MSATNGAKPVTQPVRDFRAEAEQVRAGKSYDGRLSMPLLRELEPLLEAPIPPEYIEHTASVKGKPYESTGIRSPQVQVDRLNAVLGVGHWTYLTYHTDAGELCKVWALVGNDLHLARLADGELDANGAEILAYRVGWGGHGRGSGRGDLFKGSETNAVKRVLARLGPGCEVYRLDFEDNPDDDRTPPPPTQAQAPTQTPRDTSGAGQEAAGDPDEEIIELLGKKSTLQGLRRNADALMVQLGAGPKRRLEELRNAGTTKDLEALVSAPKPEAVASNE
jgi:hypothetical protein